MTSSASKAARVRAGFERAGWGVGEPPAGSRVVSFEQPADAVHPGATARCVVVPLRVASAADLERLRLACELATAYGVDWGAP